MEQLLESTSLSQVFTSMVAALQHAHQGPYQLRQFKQTVSGTHQSNHAGTKSRNACHHCALRVSSRNLDMGHCQLRAGMCVRNTDCCAPQLVLSWLDCNTPRHPIEKPREPEGGLYHAMTGQPARQTDSRWMASSLGETQLTIHT